MSESDIVQRSGRHGLTPEIGQRTAKAAPSKAPNSSPRQWLKDNLFSSPFNSVLTVVASVLILLIVRGLLGFTFNPTRQWEGVATNLRLLMTRSFPADRYIRVWVSVGTLLTLTGTSMAVWRAGTQIPLNRVGRRIVAIGVFGVLTAILAPFSALATVQWLIAALLVTAVGEVLRRTVGEGQTEQTVSTITLSVLALAGMVASLWVLPYGQHTYDPTRTPRMLAEPGTVAMTTKLPWTIMLVVLVAAYFAGRVLRDRLPANPTRATLVVLWLLAPPILLFLVLRAPAFDMDHVVGTDLPVFVAYAVGGALLLSWLARPSTGEIGRIVAALILLVGFCTFLTPMRMVVRIDMLLLASFALAAPTFAGGPRARKQFTLGWIGTISVLSWMITSINTPSTIKVPGDFFIGGLSLTLMVFFFTIVFSFPLGLALALARTSTLPIFRVLATWFIEFVRGVPLITILMFFSVVAPLFLPDGMDVTEIAIVTVGYVLFSAAYLAENVRGGLQSVTRGQHEAAAAVGMTTAQKTLFIVLPQALRVAIPPLVGHCIGVFKETSLLAIIGVFDLLYIARNIIPTQSEWMGSARENLLLVSLFYWLFCYQMSKASQRLEQRTGLGER